MTKRNKILNYMKENLDSNWDIMTGDYNMTLLAEDAADYFGENIEGKEIPEIYYEIAYEIVGDEELETFVRREYND